MKFFVSEDVINSELVRIINLGRNRTKLEILDASSGVYEVIEFHMCINIFDIKKHEDIILECNRITKRKNPTRFIIARTDEFSGINCYILLKSNIDIPGEVYIPNELKDQIKIEKRMQAFEYHYINNERQRCITEFYFMKITVLKNSIFPFFYSSSTGDYLDKKIEFCKSDSSNIEISKKESTYIKLDKENCNKFISLSSL